VNPAGLALGISIGPSAAFELLPVALVSLLYAVRALALDREGRPVAAWRQACFYLGLLLVGVSIVVLAGPTRRLFTAHAIDDLLIGDLAPLLLVLGLTRELLAPMRGIPGARWLGRLCTPVPAFVLWTASLYVWHLSSFYQAALHHGNVHTLEYLTSLGAGIVMWMCLIGPVRRPRWFGLGAKLLYVVGVRVAGLVLANLLLWSGTIAYPFYLQQDALRQVSPVADQNLGGALFLLDQSLLLLVLFAWLYMASKPTLREAWAGGPLEALSGPAQPPATAGGSLEARAVPGQPPATAGRMVSSAPSATGVLRPSRNRMSSPPM
jgi:putative membrane protein